MRKVLVITTLLVFIPVICFSQTAWTVKDGAAWIDAVNGIRSGGNNKTHTITVSGNVTVLPADGATFGSVTGITVTIQGDGTLSLSRNGHLINIDNRQTVIVKNITLRGIPNNNYELVWITEGGTFRMQGSARVTDNSQGGVILTNGSNMTFIMQDNASVSGNTGGVGVYNNGGNFTMQDNASVSGNRNPSNDILVKGGGVYSSGTFTMRNNASVHNNSDSKSGGGGVYIATGTFTMQDKASVSYNSTRNGNGGGVNIYNGTFIMQGNASVSGNYALNNGLGGGVYVKSGGGSRGIFTMQGNASVSGNEALSGGGVYVDDNFGTFNMQGGTVSGNTARGNGGGVYLYYGTLNKTGGIIYGSNAKEGRKNTAGEKGFAVNNGGLNWRNATAGPTMNSGTYGFWLNEEGVVEYPQYEDPEFPSGFTGIWKRDNYNNTLTFTATTVKSSNRDNAWNFVSVSGDSYTIIADNAAKTRLTITIKLVNDNIEISGDSGSGENNWNGIWKKR